MWKCKTCGERIEDQFDTCWRCAGQCDGVTDPDASLPEIEELIESSEACVKCGSSRVVPNARLGDQGESSDGKARMLVSANPTAILFKGTARSEIVGKVCCDCGHLELRCVGNLDSLWAAHIQATKRD